MGPMVHASAPSFALAPPAQTQLSKYSRLQPGGVSLDVFVPWSRSLGKRVVHIHVHRQGTFRARLS